VLVTVVAPRTAKLCAEPSDGWADAAETLRRIAARETADSRVTRRREKRVSVIRARLRRSPNLVNKAPSHAFSFSLWIFLISLWTPSFYFQFVAVNFARGLLD
jgi:hypothetical protein